MDADDSASDKPSSNRHSRRPDSPSFNVEDNGHDAHSDRSSSKRSQPKRSREKSSEGRRKHTPSRRPKSLSENVSELKPTHGSTSASRKPEHFRHQRKKSRSRDVGENIETPVTRVLRDVPDDILDTPHSHLHGIQQHTYLDDVDNEHYRIQNERDCVYVEHHDGFSSVPRHSALADHGVNSEKSWFDLSDATALDLAIVVQKTWLPFTDFCHGLLAGISLMQAILVDRLLGSSPEEVLQFISFYSNFSLIFTTTFFLLASVCLVSIFDRLDLARGDWPYLVDLFSMRPRIPWLLIPTYTGGFILALAAAKGDDWIYLSQFNISNLTLLQTDLDLLKSWHVLNSLRCACVVVGWFLLSANHPPDLLLNLLIDMLPHQNVDKKPKAKAERSSLC